MVEDQLPAERTALRIRRRKYPLSSGTAYPLLAIPNHLSSAKIIVLAGPTESGKTTLVTSVYEAFHRGPFGGYSFAGSETLVAFEERCHEGRLQSGLDIAKTRRTSRSESGDLMHLAVMPTNPTMRARSHILINDVTGEYFDDLLDRPEAASAMTVLSLADRIQVVLDGRPLMELGRRDQVAYEAEVLARAIADYGHIKPGTRVDAVVTKLDVLENAGASTVEFARLTAARVLERIPVASRGLTFMTCARSELPTKTRTGEGVPGVLATWANPQISSGPPS